MLFPAELKKGILCLIGVVDLHIGRVSVNTFEGISESTFDWVGEHDLCINAVQKWLPRQGSQFE